jgi:hypothetical protein
VNSNSNDVLLDMRNAPRVIGGILMFILGLLAATMLVQAGTANVLFGMGVWLASGALMGVGLALPMRRPVLGAAIGILVMGAVVGVLAFLFRNGT